MLLTIFLSTLTFIVLFIAAYTDLKTREIPDWLNFAFIISALGVRGIFSVEYGWEIIVGGILGFMLCFAIACLFYYMHQWGGGDSKLLMGMGAVIGITYPFSEQSLLLVLFLGFLLVGGAVYGLIWTARLALQKKAVFSSQFRSLLQEHKLLHASLGGLSCAILGATFLFFPVWPLVFFPLGIFYLFLFITAAEKTCFIRRITPWELTEGDWLAEGITIDGKKLFRKKTVLQSEITSLQNLYTKGKIKRILIKDGIPFTPAFILALVMVLLWPYLKIVIVNVIF